MKRKFRYSFGLTLLLVQAMTGRGQVDSTRRTDSTGRADSSRMTAAVQAVRDTTGRHSVAIFAPLYLDSAFDATGNYRYDKTFPKFINPGLEFYEGVQLALDSLQKEKALLDARIYDTRSTS